MVVKRTVIAEPAKLPERESRETGDALLDDLIRRIRNSGRSHAECAVLVEQLREEFCNIPGILAAAAVPLLRGSAKRYSMTPGAVRKRKHDRMQGLGYRAIASTVFIDDVALCELVSVGVFSDRATESDAQLANEITQLVHRYAFLLSR